MKRDRILYISVEKHTNYTALMISRPDRLNAIGTSISLELLHLLSGYCTSIEAKCLVIRAPEVEQNGQKISIAGGDLKELALLNRLQAGKYCRQMSRVCELLERAPIPTIFLTDGGLIGGGAELAMACDIRLGTVASTFVFKQMHIGLATGYGSCERMVRLLGKALTQKLLFTDPVLSPDQALNIGLLHKKYNSKEDLEAALPELIAFYSNFGLDAWNAQKKMLNSIPDKKSIEVTERENNIFTALWKNPTHMNALRKFTIKKDSL